MESGHWTLDFRQWALEHRKCTLSKILETIELLMLPFWILSWWKTTVNLKCTNIYCKSISVQIFLVVSYESGRKRKVSNNKGTFAGNIRKTSFIHCLVQMLILFHKLPENLWQQHDHFYKMSRECFLMI